MNEAIRDFGLSVKDLKTALVDVISALMLLTVRTHNLNGLRRLTNRYSQRRQKSLNLVAKRKRRREVKGYDKHC